MKRNQRVKILTVVTIFKLNELIMVTITKVGKDLRDLNKRELANSNVYIETCKRCETEFKFQRDDFSIAFEDRSMKSPPRHVKCPHCNLEIGMVSADDAVVDEVFGSTEDYLAETRGLGG